MGLYLHRLPSSLFPHVILATQTLEVVVGHIMNLAELFARKYELSEEERSLTIFHLLSRFGDAPA